jgi:hypothetical protein
MVGGEQMSDMAGLQKVIEEVWDLLGVDLLDHIFGEEPQPEGLLKLDNRLNEITRDVYKIDNELLACYLRASGVVSEELPSYNALYVAARCKMLESLPQDVVDNDYLYGLHPTVD